MMAEQQESKMTPTVTSEKNATPAGSVSDALPDQAAKAPQGRIDPQIPTWRLVSLYVR